MKLCLAYSHFYQQYWDSKNVNFVAYEISVTRGVPLRCEILKIVARLCNKV